MSDVNVRPYQDSDFELLKLWYRKWEDCEPIESMHQPDSTFVLEYKGRPVMSMMILLSQSKEFSFLEGFIRDREFQLPKDYDLGMILGVHCMHFAKQKGYKRCLALAACEKTSERYQEAGLRVLGKELILLGKEF